MKHVSRSLAPAAIIAIAVCGVMAVRADADSQNAYLVTPIVSDLSGKANVTDPNLKNAWGVAFTPSAGAFWISDNASGLSTLYDGAGTIVNLPLGEAVFGQLLPCPAFGGQGITTGVALFAT